MSKVRELRVSIVEATRKQRELIRAIKAEITALPDNPKIARLGPRCFTIRSSDLGTANWTPEYHDFKLQYEEVAAALKRVQPSRAVGRLKAIINAEEITKNVSGGRYAGSQRQRIRLHPDVVNHLRKLMDMPPRTEPTPKQRRSRERWDRTLPGGKR